MDIKKTKVFGYQVHEDRFFLIFALCFGIILVFLTPPFQVPDEPAHFLRAYQVSDINFMPAVENNSLGGYVPLSTYQLMAEYNGLNNINKRVSRELINAARCISLNPEVRNFGFFPNTSLYSPVPYLPQAVGINIGKVFNAPPLFLFYLGRLLNLFAWILLMFHAIRIIPMGKWLFVVLALLPMNMQLAASLNADAMTIGLTFVFIAMVVRLIVDDKTAINIKTLTILAILAVLIALSKSVYIFPVLLIFLIPIKKYDGIKKYLLANGIIAALAFGAALAGVMVVNHLIGQIQPIEHFYGTDPITPKINPGMQMEFIFSDIPGFVMMVIRSFQDKIYMVSYSFIGILGWMCVVLPTWYYLSAIAFIIFITLTSFNQEYNFSLFMRFVFLTLFVAILGVFSFTMYCSWTEPGAAMIDNLQGRYFLPAAPLALLAFANTGIRISEKIKFTLVLLFFILSLLITVKALLFHYYI